MAASSKVNASVEQVNVSSGWDEAHNEVFTAPVPVELDKKSSPRLSKAQVSAVNVQARLRMVELQVLNYLRQGRNECGKIARAVGRQMQWAKEEHPGYIVIAAGMAGFACGLLLRTRRSRKEINLYE